MVSIGILGVGNIAGAFLSGILSSQSEKIYSINLIGKDNKHGQRLSQQWNLPHLSLLEAFKNVDILIISVKPSQLMHLIDDFVDVKPILVSFVNGISCSFYEEKLAGNSGVNDGKVAVIRAMPNTAMQVGKGVIALSAGKYATGQDIELIRTMLSNTGTVFDIPESLQSSFTALAGSGPAYVYFFAETLIDASVAQGIPRDLAARLTALTIEGAAALLLTDPNNPASLRADVTSPGGSTAVAIAELEKYGVRSAFYDAIAAARTKIDSVSK